MAEFRLLSCLPFGVRDAAAARPAPGPRGRAAATALAGGHPALGDRAGDGRGGARVDGAGQARAEEERDAAIRTDGRYDTASALLQVGIVMASAAIITGTAVLVWAGAALGGAGALPSVLTFLGVT